MLVMIGLSGVPVPDAREPRITPGAASYRSAKDVFRSGRLQFTRDACEAGDDRGLEQKTFPP